MTRRKGGMDSRAAQPCAHGSVRHVWQAEREAQHRAEVDRLRTEMETERLAIKARERHGAEAIAKLLEGKLAAEQAERSCVCPVAPEE